ncbi:protein chibby homolog 2 [Indicator indicator]|uniref:protein chibby homolog 2 n=1 Tax=Indicator indicator TaxID=1002788 RepID=UPI0023DF81A9|nr:protein chibby homolog 2 [Indicator indicator]
MSGFDLTRQDMESTEPETDCIIPRIKLRDEVFVYIDGKWVKEIYCQPPLATHWELCSKKAQNDWSVWEENKALREENRVLQIQNRMLWEENKALQCLQSQNEAVQVTYTDVIHQSLQKENKPFPFFQERNLGFQVNPGNKALQAVQEYNRVLEDFQQETKPAPTIWKEQEAITVCEESKDANSDLQEDTDASTDVEEDKPGPAALYKHEAKKKNSTSTQNKTKSASSKQGEYEIIQVLRDLYELLHIFLKVNHLPGNKQDCNTLHNVKRSFQEDHKKLKLQLNAVKNTVSDIKAQMETLEKELIAITSPVYKEAEHKLATEY